MNIYYIAIIYLSQDHNLVMFLLKLLVTEQWRSINQVSGLHKQRTYNLYITYDTSATALNSRLLLWKNVYYFPLSLSTKV